MDDERVNSSGKSWIISTSITFIGVGEVVGLWTFIFGYDRIETRKYSRDIISRYFVFAMVHHLFSLTYLFIGQWIIVEQYLALAWFQQDDQGKDDTTKSRPIIVRILLVVVRILVTTVSMLIMAGSVYYGYKVAAEAYVDAMYDGLASSIGILTVAYGFVYLIICMGGFVEHVLDRMNRSNRVTPVTDLGQP